MPDLTIGPQRSWENLPEPKRSTADSKILFSLPKAAEFSEVKEPQIKISTIFAKFLIQDAPIDAHQIPTDDALASLIHLGDGTMKSSQKKDKTAADDSEDIAPAVKEFAETLIESLKDNYNSKLEPFEAYAQKIRSHIFANAKSFKKRFSKGYEILLKEVEKTSMQDIINLK